MVLAELPEHESSPRNRHGLRKRERSQAAQLYHDELDLPEPEDARVCDDLNKNFRKGKELQKKEKTR